MKTRVVAKSPAQVVVRITAASRRSRDSAPALGTTVVARLVQTVARLRRVNAGYSGI